jgi:hypothetical protein
MQPNDLPIVCLPLDLSDEAAASLIEFLQELTTALQRHYYAQLCRPNPTVLRRTLELGEYTAIAFGRRCKELGVRPSMG